MNFTNEGIEKILKDKFHTNIKIKSIGNHDLNRHMVYKIDGAYDFPIVFKIFYKKNRRNRELASLKLLSNENIKAPNLIDYGELSNGTEWMITNYIEGTNLCNVINDMNDYQRSNILKEMGIELGKLHTIKEFDFFGNWDEDGNSTEENNDFKSVFIKRTEITISNLLKQSLPEEDIFKEAIRILRDNYYILDDVKKSRLCHNDFDGRNILVVKDNNNWTIKGIIDFEQALPWDIDNEIAYLYHKYFLKNSSYTEYFLEGYKKYVNYNLKITNKIKFYLIYKGIEICSWSNIKAPDYYEEGLNLVKKFYKDYR